MTEPGGLPLKVGVISRIRLNIDGISPAERRVSDFVTAHPEQVLDMSLAELAAAAGVSDATALRFARSIGFSGFTEMKMALVADLTTPVEAVFEYVEDGDDPDTIIHKVLAANMSLIRETIESVDAVVFTDAVASISRTQDIIIVGMGSSIGDILSLQNRLLRIGRRASVMTDPYQMAAHASLLNPDWVMIAISRSGAPASVVRAVEAARESGASTVALTCSPTSRVARAADLSLWASTWEIRSELVGSRAGLASLIDAIYVAVALADVEGTVSRQRRVWDALKREP